VDFRGFSASQGINIGLERAKKMIRPGAHPTAIEARSSGESKMAVVSPMRTDGSGAGAGGPRPLIDARRGMSTDVKSANRDTGKRGRRGNGPVGPAPPASSNLDRPYTSARLNAVRNSTINKRGCIGTQLPQDRGKLTVVLDVDETLIHSRLSAGQQDFRQAEERKESAAAVEEFTIQLDDGEIVHVNKRPGLDKFLQYASEHYELFAYTAGLEEYARPLLDWLDPKGTIFRGRLYRDSCLFMRGYYLKDLQKLNRPLQRIVLVDNNAFCFLPQLSNGVPISSWYDDANDTALTVLTTFLDRIRDEKDVRPFLHKSFNLETLLKDHREQIIG